MLFHLLLKLWWVIEASGTCVSDSSQWHRLCVLVCLLLLPAPEKSLKIELCTFLGHMLGSRGSSALKRALLHVCLVHPSAEAGFSLWWSMSLYLLQLWLLAVGGSCPSAPSQRPKGAGVSTGNAGAVGAGRQLWSIHGPQAWLSCAPGAVWSVLHSPWNRWHLNFVWGVGEEDWKLTWLTCFEWGNFQASFMHNQIFKNIFSVSMKIVQS